MLIFLEKPVRNFDFCAPAMNNDKQKAETFLETGRDLQVIGIYMYLRDDQCPLSDFEHLYDILLTDGESKLKCFLHPSAYHFVKLGKVVIGTTIRVKEACMQQMIPILQTFTVTGIHPTPDSSTLPFLAPSLTRQIDPIPLYAQCLYYLHPWIPTIPFGPDWTNPDPSLYSTTPAVNAGRYTLLKLEKLFKRGECHYPQMIVTVLHRGHFHNFGEAGQDNDSPFEGRLLVGDHTGLCGAILWGEKNTGMQWHIKPGDKLLLWKYTIEESNTFEHLEFRFHEEDILSMVFYLGPSSVVRIVKDSEIPRIDDRYWGPFPQPVYRFVPRRLLSSVHHGMVVDVIGYATYVGYSVRKKRDDGFVSFRWIELLDDTSQIPVKIKMILDHQWQIQEKIMPGQLLICTYLQVIRYDTSRSHGPVHVFLKSTRESGFFLTPPFQATREERVQEFLQWYKHFRDKLEINLAILTHRVGGLIPQPFAISNNQNHNVPRKQTANSESVNAIVELNTLEIRQIKTTFVCGTIKEVTFLKLEGRSIFREKIFRCHHKCVDNFVDTNNELAFPRIYLPDANEDIATFLGLPIFLSEIKTFIPNRQNISPFSPTNVYEVVIFSHEPAIGVKTVFFPKTAARPFPSLEGLFEGKYQQKTNYEINTGPVEISSEQNGMLKKTARKICSRTFTFEVNFFRYGNGQNVAVLVAAR